MHACESNDHFIIFVVKSAVIRLKDVCVPPWEVGWVTVRNDFDDLAIDGNSLVARWFDISVKDAESGVVLEEVGSLFDTSSVVDGDDI